jgi:hypothetical protein
MENQNLSPDEQDIDAFSTPVQNFAFGGIANPAQRAVLRGSDKAYLSDRQKELDAFEAQRVAYNDQLTKWQDEVYKPYQTQVDAFNTGAQRYNEEVYNPYKAQVDAYNAELAKYNEEVYNPYKTQFSDYEKAINDYNAGERTSDYAGPAAPTLAREFSLTAPTEPTAFGMAQPTAPEDFKGVAPVLPFKEEEVQAFQQQAADRARKDAGNRAVAIDVVSNPDQFNFGSMSVANRFMAKGGEVKAKGKSAKEMLGEMDGGYEPDDASILKMAQEISSKGKLSHRQIMEAVDRVAAAGRGGDELLAYLSPASVEVLKKMGGAGSINPATGLHEFKGGVIGSIVNAVKKVFGGGSSSGAAAPATPPAQQVQREVEYVSEGDGGYNRPTGRYFIPEYTMDGENMVLSRKNYVDAKYVTEEVENDGENSRVNYMYRAPPPEAPAAPATTPAVTDLQKLVANTPGVGTGGIGVNIQPLPTAATTPATPAATPTQTATPTPAVQPTAPPAAVPIATPVMGQPTPAKGSAADDFAKLSTAAKGPSPNPMDPSFVGPRTVDEEARFKAGQNIPIAPTLPPPPVIRDPRTAGQVQGPAGSTAQLINRSAGTISASTPAAAMLNTLNAANPLAKVELGGRISSPTGGRTQQPGTQPVARGPENSSGGSIPITAPTMPVYSDRGVGAVGDVGGIRIQGPSTPVFGNERLTMGGAATNPSSYFGMSQPRSPGVSAGTTAIGSSDMPMFGAMNTMNTLGQNKNLSPTMLGGQENAGYMTDRLGNRIYAPGMAPLYGFAKGGLADVNEFNMADAEDEPINTDPAGSAQKLLADLTGPTKSVTEVTESPNAKSIKRVSKKTSGGGGASAAKGMSMEYEALSSAKDLVPQLKDDGSARSQMEALALAYKLRAQQASDKSRGLMRNTLGAPTLEQPTLTKGRLTAKRFEKGGEAKKDSAKEGEPGLFGVSDYSTRAAEDMFPGQMGQDDQRDAARHMLAAGLVARKYGPGTAEFLGKVHERVSSPESFFSMFGIGKPRDDYEMDVHNNRIGAELAARSTSQAELEKLVAAMARQSQNKKVEGKPWTMSREQMEARKNKGMTPPPEYKKGGAVTKPKKKSVGS